MDFLSNLWMALSSAKIHRFSLFLEYASSTYRSEKPDCYIQRNDIQAGKFYIEAQTKISLWSIWLPNQANQTVISISCRIWTII